MNKPNDTRPQTLEAAEFVLRDAAGRIGARLDIGPTGPRLLLFDANGTTRAGLAVTGDGPGLTVYDSNGKPRAGLAVIGDLPVLNLLDPGGDTRASLGLAEDGPGLTLRDASGEPRAWLLVTDEGQGLELRGPAGPAIIIATPDLRNPPTGRKSKRAAAYSSLRPQGRRDLVRSLRDRAERWTQEQPRSESHEQRSRHGIEHGHR